MKTYTLFHTASGFFTGRTLSIPANMLALNTPDGMGAIEGNFDHLCQRLDLVTREVVDWTPPAPADDEFRAWSWDTGSRRWVAAPTAAARGRDIRSERDRLLSASDWTQLADAELDAAGRQAWVLYRRALRRIPLQPGFPDVINWPVPPPA